MYLPYLWILIILSIAAIRLLSSGYLEYKWKVLVVYGFLNYVDATSNIQLDIIDFLTLVLTLLCFGVGVFMDKWEYCLCYGFV